MIGKWLGHSYAAVLIASAALVISFVSLAVSLWVAVYDRRRRLRVKLAYGRQKNSPNLWMSFTITNIGRVPVTVTEATAEVKAADGSIKGRFLGARLPATLGQSERTFVNMGSYEAWRDLLGVSAVDSVGKEWRVSPRVIRALRRDARSGSK